MGQLWLIRHFRTPWNSQGRLQGRRDVALDDPLGEDDLAALAFNLKELAGQNFSLVLTSPLRRARQTAALHGFPAAVSDPDLAELCFGTWEGRTWADLEAAHPGLWRSDPHRLPLGEALADFLARIQRVQHRVITANAPVLAFGHGAWLSGLRQLLDGTSGFHSRTIGNGALIRLDLSPRLPVPAER
jgi:probable phosphoglycerate mutase